jgi:hypothetical protein
MDSISHNTLEGSCSLSSMDPTPFPCIGNSPWDGGEDSDSCFGNPLRDPTPLLVPIGNSPSNPGEESNLLQS